MSNQTEATRAHFAKTSSLDVAGVAGLQQSGPG